jgi:hypothetical protein
MWMLAAVALLTVGDPFPALKGEFLSGRTAVLPDVSQGRVALLAFGFTYDSRFAVEAWVKRFRQSFPDKSRTTFYEIPMIGGMARLGKWFIDSGMRRGTPKDDHENVITVYGGIDPWRQRLAVHNPNHAYLVLLDSQGAIRWLHHGDFEESAFAQLQATVESLLP